MASSSGGSERMAKLHVDPPNLYPIRDPEDPQQLIRPVYDTSYDELVRLSKLLVLERRQPDRSTTTTTKRPREDASAESEEDEEQEEEEEDFTLSLPQQLLQPPLLDVSELAASAKAATVSARRGVDCSRGMQHDMLTLYPVCITPSKPAEVLAQRRAALGNAKRRIDALLAFARSHVEREKKIVEVFHHEQQQNQQSTHGADVSRHATHRNPFTLQSCESFFLPAGKRSAAIPSPATIPPHAIVRFAQRLVFSPALCCAALGGSTTSEEQLPHEIVPLMFNGDELAFAVRFGGPLWGGQTALSLFVDGTKKKSASTDMPHLSAVVALSAASTGTVVKEVDFVCYSNPAMQSRIGDVPLILPKESMTKALQSSIFSALKASHTQLQQAIQRTAAASNRPVPSAQAVGINPFVPHASLQGIQFLLHNCVLSLLRHAVTIAYKNGRVPLEGICWSHKLIRFPSLSEVRFKSLCRNGAAVSLRVEGVNVIDASSNRAVASFDQLL